MGLTRAEQETILRWDEEEQVVHLYSASPKMWRKAARIGLKPVKETTLRGEPTGKFYRFPVADLSWRRLGPKMSRTPRPPRRRPEPPDYAADPPDRFYGRRTQSGDWRSPMRRER